MRILKFKKVHSNCYRISEEGDNYLCPGCNVWERENRFDHTAQINNMF